MKSVSIVAYKKGTDGLPDTLTEIARHFQTTWGTAVAHVAEHTFLESDAEGNVMVLHQNVNGVTADDRRRLEVTSEMLLGEMVNRIRRITVPTSPDATVMPRAFLGTVSTSSSHIFPFSSHTRQYRHAGRKSLTASAGRRINLPVRAHRAQQTRPPHASADQHGKICPEPW
jgi:DNA damage-binding protein 1